MQKQSNIISGETATELSMDSQPDEIDRLKRELVVRQEAEKEAKEAAPDITAPKEKDEEVQLVDKIDNRLKTAKK